ncbi:MAG: hypothetical protein ACRDSR_20805 [Pseudonocardiaceae bacterium]
MEKFGAPPLPVELSHTGGTALTKLGKDLALYYADFLLGVIFQPSLAFFRACRHCA